MPNECITKKSIALLIALLLIVTSGIGITVWRFSQNESQTVRTDAQVPASVTSSVSTNNLSTASTRPAAEGGTCDLPSEVTNVEVNYPSCN